MRRISIELDIPWTLSGVRCALAAITATNRILMKEWLKDGRRPPRLYDSGVRYRREPPERFTTFDQVLLAGAGDCDQLCAWRAAELQELGTRAIAVPRLVTPDQMHIVIHFPGGTVEDPSRLLGMGKRVSA